MKRKPRRSFASPIRMDLTPMIDVTFLLLIFFMLTISFTTLDHKLESRLPKHQGGNPSEAPPSMPARVVIEVLVEGTRLEPVGDGPWSGVGPHRFGDDRVLRYTCGPRAFRALADVQRYLTLELARDPELELVVDARRDTIYADALAVIDLAGVVGIDTVTLAAARP
jgi:biopolymer transport protein ExbD